MSDIKRMPIEEFQREGYLAEVNRVAFHPLGLALEVTSREDGSMFLSSVWDYRDDPEGVRTKLHKLQADRAVKCEHRERTLGYPGGIEPIDAPAKEESA